MPGDRTDDNQELLHGALTDQVIGLAIRVHRELGPGLMESAYEACLAYELVSLGLSFERQVALPVRYRDQVIDAGYRIDLFIERAVIVEIKSVDRLIPVHQAQLLTYMKLAPARVGLLVNFNVPMLKDGLIRCVL